MAEILFGNPILQAWRVEADFRRWQTLLAQTLGDVPHAILHFAEETKAELTGFIAELRVDQDHQLLRPYQYQLFRVDEVVANRQKETAGIDGVHQRDAATEVGIRKIHDYFQSNGDGSQAVRISPVNEAAGQPEYKYTAIYFTAYTGEVVDGWQLFVDFSPQERKDYMAWVSRRAGADYCAGGDLDLAANPVLSESSANPLYNSIHKFIADVAKFRKNTRGRASISEISLENPDEFIAGQLRLEAKNRQEAEVWVDPYVRAIAQGSIELGRRIITNLQLKVLGLTESAVRAAARLASVDFSALQVFLRACGFLSFSFSPETSIVSPQSFFVAPALSSHCQEKICHRCGTHAGDHDTKCPSCGWSP